MGLEGLFLDEALEADVTLERPHAVVDEHVPLQVGGQGELSGTHVTLVAFHSLQSANRTKGSISRIKLKDRTDDMLSTQREEGRAFWIRAVLFSALMSEYTAREEQHPVLLGTTEECVGKKGQPHV